MDEKEMLKRNIITEKDLCVRCGCYVPEGRQICVMCEQNSGKEDKGENIKKLAI